MGAGSPSRKAKVLLVTGEPLLRRALTRLLSRDSSLLVIESSCGKDAFELAMTAGIDVVAMDCDLPDASGYEITRALRRQADSPIILLFANPGQWDDSVEAGAHDFITKPFDDGEFVARVRQLVDRRNRESGSGEFDEQPPIHVGNLLRIEPANRSVWIIERDGSSTQVQLQCWGDQRPVGPHAVEEMIRKIRSK